VAGELEKLQQDLENKEAQMARVLNGDGQIASLKGHYDRMLTELQCERDELKKERIELLQVAFLPPSLEHTPTHSSAISVHHSAIDRSRGQDPGWHQGTAMTADDTRV
jgi:hypothetical protein